MFCKHKWEIVVNEYEKAPLTKIGPVKMSEYDGDILFGKRIIILQCTKCGKLDKTIEVC